MKHFLTGTIAIILFAAMLFFPKAVFQGASDGLLLWFQIVVPTLFPFMIITGFLLQWGGLHMLCRIVSPVFHRLFGVSWYGSFAVLSGFLCGYPMGAKITADLVRKGSITTREGRYLLSFCNNTSPIFIMNFIVWKTFHDYRLMLPTLFILMAVPVLSGLLFRCYYGFGYRRSVSDAKPPSTNAGSLTFEAVDSCLMDSLEAIAKIGGYLILFSVLAALLHTVTDMKPVRALSAILEMTNGIVLLNQMELPLEWKYSMTLGLTTFGGLCSAAQTQSMIQGTGISIFPYIAQKLAAAVAASLLAMYYITTIYSL